ncbi:MAG: DUF3300 domain-containing protein, partial [Candidatus Binatia bacterium]
ERIDWTISLGQAYVEQPEDVMASVQFLRRQAHRHGNLVSNRHHEVLVEREYVEIVPVHPEVIYVPVYEPAAVFFAPAVITFGVAFPIGVWLIHDFDWHGHRIYYHGWGHGHHHHWRGHRHWAHRSRPHVRINNVYVNNRFNTVRVNRDVVRRNVNVTNLNRFTSVNRDVRFDNVERRNRARGRAGDPGNFRTSRRDADNPRNDNLRGRPGVAPRSAREGAGRGPENGSIQPQDRRQQARESREENRAEARERLRQSREAREQRGARQGNPAEPTPDNRSLRSRDDRAPDGRIDRSQRGPDAQDQNRAEARERLRQARENREQRGRQGNAAEPTDNRRLRTREPAVPPRLETPQARPRFREERPPQDNRPFRGREIAPSPRVERGQQGREDRQAPALPRPPRATFRENRSVEQNRARSERREAREKRNGIGNRDRGPGREI